MKLHLGFLLILVVSFPAFSQGSEAWDRVQKAGELRWGGDAAGARAVACCKGGVVVVRWLLYYSQ